MSDPLSTIQAMVTELEATIAQLVEDSDAFDWDTCDLLDAVALDIDATVKGLVSAISDQRSKLVTKAGGRFRVGNTVWRIKPKQVQRFDHALIREAIVKEVLADGAESVLGAVRAAVGLTFTTYLSDSSKAKREALNQIGLDPAQVSEWVANSKGGTELVGIEVPATMAETEAEGDKK